MAVQVNIIPAKDCADRGLRENFHKENPSAVSIHFNGTPEELSLLNIILTGNEDNGVKYSVMAECSDVYGSHILYSLQVIAQSLFGIRPVLENAQKAGIEFQPPLVLMSRQMNSASLSNYSLASR